MTANSSRAAPPALRIGLSTLASLLLHLAVFWPLGASLQRGAPVPVPPLEAVLLAPALATHPEEPGAAEPKPAEPPTPPPAAVPPAPTLRGRDAKPPPAPTSMPKPRELRGRALNTALAELAKQDFYPRAAIERGLEGDVIVLLTLNLAGGVAEASVATSSGHAILDAAALAAVRRIGGLPAERRQVLLPVQFRLD